MRYLKKILGSIISVKPPIKKPVAAKRVRPNGDKAVHHVLTAKVIRKEQKGNWEKAYVQNLIMAMKHGHNSGHAPENLSKFLSDEETLHQAIEVCELVLDKEYQFDSGNEAWKERFAKRLSSYKVELGHSEYAGVRPSLFTPEERAEIIAASKRNTLAPNYAFLAIFALAVSLFGCGITDGNNRGPNGPTEWNGTWVSPDGNTIATIEYPNWEAKYQEDDALYILSGKMEYYRTDTAIVQAGRLDSNMRVTLRANAKIYESSTQLFDGTRTAYDTAQAKIKFGFNQNSGGPLGHSKLFSLQPNRELLGESLSLPRKADMKRQ